MTAPQKFEFTKKAIETRYRSFLFRSRLEARWAAFFDLCNWRWGYEPPELPGWIPDFVLGEHPLLVEVRPYFDSHLWHDRCEAIMASGCRERVILLGADPVWLSAENSISDAPHVGWLHVPVLVEKEWESYLTDLHFGVTDGNGRLGVTPLDDAWDSAVWKCNGKAGRVFLNERDRERELVERWAAATAISQWMPLEKTGA